MIRVTVGFLCQNALISLVNLKHVITYNKSICIFSIEQNYCILIIMNNDRCITCLSFRDELSESLWGYKEIPLDISNKLKQIANVEISDTNYVARSLCNKCVERLNDAYDFIKLCEMSIIYITNYLKTLQIDIINTSNVSEMTLDSHVIKEKDNFQKEQDECNVSVTKISEPYTPKNYSYEKHSSNIVKRRQSDKTRLVTYVCDSCGSVFKNKTGLNIHSQSHTDNKPFVCSICYKGFTVKTNLTNHMHCHSGERLFVCDICGLRFTVMSSLKAHIRIHTNEKPFTCTICDKSFSQQSNLKAHVLIHTGEKSHKCTSCLKTFYTASAMRQHYRRHTGERPFSCSICLKSFSMSTNLRTHMKIHLGHKKYQCAVCQNNYINMAALNSHMHIHTGLKKFTCSTCPKRFAHYNTLKAHQVVHTKRKDFECNICNKIFARTSSLSAHRKKRHLLLN